METNKELQNKIASTFDAFDAIQEVKVSPFFKDKTMQRLFAKKEENLSIWNWFTPQWQFATLVCVILLNVFAFSKMETAATYDENINKFAETYGMTTSTDTSILN